MSTATLDQFLSVVSGFNAAAVGDRQWPEVLSELAVVVPGVFATFELMDKRTGSYLDFHSSAVIDVDEAYLDHYFRLNPRLPGVLGQPDLVLMSDYDFLSEAEIDRNEFYNDFLKPFELRYCAGIRLLDTRDEVATVSIQRSLRHGHVDEHDLGLLGLLRAHLSQAARTYLKFGALITEKETLETGLNALADGVVIVGRDRRAQYMNPAAAAIFRANQGMSILGGRVSIAPVSAHRAFECAILSALDPVVTNRPASHQIVVPRPIGLPAYILTAMPVSAQNREIRSSWHGGAIVFIRDPARPGRPVGDILRQSCGLTKSEAEVACALGAGQTVKQIADARQVSLATVRSQVRSILGKTGQPRTASLIRWLAQFSMSAG